MSFEQYEESVESGSPIELYTFAYAAATFRFTSADRDITVDSETYTQHAGLTRSAIDDTGEIAKANITITAPENFIVAKLFEVYPPSDVVTLTLQRVQASDLTDPKTIWLGRVLNAKWSVGFSTLLCESIFTRLRTPGLRRIYSRNCPHVLYGAACRAQETLFEELVDLIGISDDGFQVQSGAFALHPDGFYANGKLTYEVTPGVFERRGIREHVGQTITLTHPIAELSADSIVTVVPGCDRTRDTCDNRFDNVPNYGGFPFIPERNPFGAGSVF